MKIYKTKAKKLPGTNYSEVLSKALNFYSKIKKRTKRRPYIRSAYFKKDKIFLGLFWSHLKDSTNLRDKTRRLKLLPCAIELLEKSQIEPKSKENPNKKNEILHRFYGKTSKNEKFCVQIKLQKRNNHKYLISIFPSKW